MKHFILLILSLFLTLFARSQGLENLITRDTDNSGEVRVFNREPIIIRSKKGADVSITVIKHGNQGIWMEFAVPPKDFGCTDGPTFVYLIEDSAKKKGVGDTSRYHYNCDGISTINITGRRAKFEVERFVTNDTIRSIVLLARHAKVELDVSPAISERLKNIIAYLNK